MDPALALAQAYLQINGYFTVTDYPIVEAMGQGYRAATDLDILAVRLPGAGHLVLGRGQAGKVRAADPELGASDEGVDLIIAEVKQGAAELNKGAREPRVLEAAISRFGACPEHEAKRIAEELVETGIARYEDATIRMVAFGSHAKQGAERPYKTITLGHVADYVRAFVERHWEIIKHIYIANPTVGLVQLVHKVREREANG